MGLTGQRTVQLRDPAEAGAAAAVLCGGEDKIADKVQEIVLVGLASGVMPVPSCLSTI